VLSICILAILCSLVQLTVQTEIFLLVGLHCASSSECINEAIVEATSLLLQIVLI
jgi:hypothetical protein